MSGRRLDPVTFEVILHKLNQIAEEMCISYINCSGSEPLVQANDGNAGITLADGSMVVVGPYVIIQANVLPLTIAKVLERCRENPGIGEGDMFICNDPWVGPIHQPDITTVAPLFHGGEIFCWTGASGHQSDVGGKDPGGFSIGVVDVHQEGLRMPPAKLVEGGELRRDLFDWVLNAVRDPLVGLDVKAQIAANHVGQARLRELIERFGAETVKACMEESIRYSESRFRKRLTSLPDGTWRTRQYIDHDGHAPNLYKLECTMTKRGDRLAFDYEGTDPQVRSQINCTYTGLIAGTLTPVYIMLCHDIPWNRGILNRVDIRAPEGVINNCLYPTPCSMATVSACYLTLDLAAAAIAQMCAASPDYHQEAMAIWTAASVAPMVSGTNQHGHPFSLVEMSHFAAGGGALTHRDGVDSAGMYFTTTPLISNIETTEQFYPVLYLFRRQLPDSGGPGMYRGGCAGEIAFIPHGHGGEFLETVLIGTGHEMPNSVGLWGGFPGGCGRHIRIRGSEIAERLGRGDPLPASLEGMGGEWEVFPPKAPRTPFFPGQVWYSSWQGAGGYGDPLDRDPEKVLADVAGGLVSPSCAREIYGVVPSPEGGVDHPATEALRERHRAERRSRAGGGPAGGGPVECGEPPRLVGRGLRCKEYVVWDEARGELFCRKCGFSFGPLDADPKGRALWEDAPLSRAGPVMGQLYDRGRFVLRLYYCPGCLALLECEVLRRGDPPVGSQLARARAGMPRRAKKKG
ncbi:MAG: hydantoinase B/oxoprolinase family protein [Nitrospinota bacterium]